MVMWMRKSLGRTVTPSGPGVKAADEQGSVEPSQLESPMLHVVPEDVAHRVRHLARALQLAGVKPVGEHLAAHSVRLVEAPSHPNGQSLHATGQRDRILRLDEHVHVIALDAEMSHTEAEALLSFAERLLDGAEVIAEIALLDGVAVTWAGVRRDCFRGTCGTPARAPFDFRPAPLRFPPQLRNYIASCFIAASTRLSEGIIVARGSDIPCSATNHPT